MSNYMDYLNRKYESIISENEEGNPIKEMKGGIFTHPTRKKLLLSVDKEKRDKDFWSDIREYVKNTIVDLELFLNVADESQVQQVITANKMKDLFESMLGNDARALKIHSYIRPDMIRHSESEPQRITKKKWKTLSVEARYRHAKLSQLSINQGIEYFMFSGLYKLNLDGNSLHQRMSSDFQELIGGFVTSLEKTYPEQEKLDKYG